LAKIFVASRSFGKVADDGLRLLGKEGEIVQNPYGRALGSDELRQSLPDIDAALLGNDVCDANVIEAARKLKVISRHGTGFDSIDIKAATENGIVVANTPGVNTTAVAEHTIALIFAILRRIPDADLSLKAKKWEALNFVGEELAGKTLGVVGLGAIGKEVVKRAKAFGARVLYADKIRDVDLERRLGLLFVPLESLLEESDIISIHVPLTPETRGLINRREIALMKKGAYLINTARGEIVDSDALADELQSGRLAGAALDVFDTEPPDFGSRLFNLKKIIMTPHIAAYTVEAMRKMDYVAAENITKVLHGQIPDFVVNREVLSRRNLRMKIRA
jgi:D-3-phosphoglycerate dehydrogenase